MLEERIVFINGEFVPWDQAQVHLMCHSFGRGSAIFEVIGVQETDSSGATVFRLDSHIERFFRSAELLDMKITMNRELLETAVIETIRKNKVVQGFIKIIGFYSQIAFEILPPQPEIDIAIFVVDPKKDLDGMRFPFDQGTTLCISKWRKLDPQTVPIEAKASANYLNGMVARAEARDRGFQNVVMLDTQGFVAEGGTESIFIVKNNRLMTPALGTVLQSITRQSIIEVGRAVGMDVRECRMAPEILFEADEIFLSGTPFKVLPVRKIEDRDIMTTPGPVSLKLSTLIDDILAGRNDRFKAWLFPA